MTKESSSSEALKSPKSYGKELKDNIDMKIKKQTNVKSATNTCGIPAKPSFTKPVKTGCSAKKPTTKRQVKECGTVKRPVKPEKVESVATLVGSKRHSQDFDRAEKHIRSAIDVLCSTDIKDSQTKEIVANLAVVLMDLQSKK